MSDYEDENPYASPNGAAEAAMPEIHGIWRDGDELVVLPRGMKAPKACWVTNKTRSVSRCYLNSYSRTSLAVTTLLFIPVIGFLLYLIAMVPFLFLGYVRFRNPIAWLGWSHRLLQAAGAFVGGICIAVAIGLGFVAGFSMSLAVFLISIPFIAAGLSAGVWSDRLLIGLHTRYGKNGTYRIRGVHPDYLARLPAYDESDTTSAMTTEPGDSPFRDPASKDSSRHAPP